MKKIFFALFILSTFLVKAQTITPIGGQVSSIWLPSGTWQFDSSSLVFSGRAGKLDSLGNCCLDYYYFTFKGGIVQSVSVNPSPIVNGLNTAKSLNLSGTQLNTIDTTLMGTKCRTLMSILGYK